MANREWDRRRRRRKRYGPNRGVRRPPHREDDIKEKMVYRIGAGVPCWARREGDREWLPHATRTGHVFCGFVWRNETHYSFRQAGWDLKVPIRFVHEATPRPRPSPIGAA